MMWPFRIYVLSVWVWILMSSIYRLGTGLHQYTADELLRLRFSLAAPPLAALHFHTDIAFLPRRKYVHRGSRRYFHQDNSKPIQSFWSTSGRSQRNPCRSIDHNVLTGLPRSANTLIQSDSISVNFGLLNIRSLTNKGHLIQDLLTDRKFDFFCLTETWQQPNDFSQLNYSTPPGFVYTCQPRESGRGGGLAIIYRENWKVSPLSAPTYSSFESVVCQLSGPTPTVIAVIYRPPKFNSVFISDFADLLTNLATVSPNIILLGDFNVHVDNCDHPLTKDLLSCLDSFSLKQYINFPTHIKGHTLDLVCCSGLTPSICTADELLISDHLLLSFNVHMTLSVINNPRIISFRNIKNINLDILSSAFSSCLSSNNLAIQEDLVLFYNHSLSSILNSLAPQKTRTVLFSHSAPWYTPELRLLKAKGRQLERLYKKTGLTIHKDMFNNHVLFYQECISQTKSAYYSAIVYSSENSTKTLFSLFNSFNPPLVLGSAPTHFKFQMHKKITYICLLYQGFLTLSGTSISTK
ncbi:uncharacterized protein LOC113014514 [Astatotilapia calliptera]|uniref:uncharacterized protein LOC113014514 n=1 Tax=Astatotilapia calliptera TaxID=8154 RepID=UPI000E3FCF19|nr:uncharacterized protein LOC113014514 [Astatotilapia calliptera]